jgi:hypothetical protein
LANQREAIPSNEPSPGALNGESRGGGKMTELSIRRPLTVLMGILALVLMGFVAFTYLKVDRLPPVSFPVVFVTTI